MTERDTFIMAEEFAEVDFNEERLEKRFRQTMETLSKDPRNMEKMKVLILMYSTIAIFIMNLTYIARIHPELPCTILFEDDGWKILYCPANRTKKVPDKPYTIKEAADYVGWLEGPKRALSDGPPGVKTIWTGLQKLYTLLDYRELFDFVG
jgi:hypothetical protein